MTTTKQGHTAGPWEVRKESTVIQTAYQHDKSTYQHGRAIVAEVMPLKTKCDCFGKPVCFGPWDEETDANAQLIAAAPDLAEALKLILDSLSRAGCSSQHCYGATCLYCATRRRARAALEKAGVTA